jgi:hypothetical protein
MSATNGRIGKLWKIGTKGPIDADGGHPQRVSGVSSIGFGREDAICEYIEIMQILPGSSDDWRFINASAAICNMAGLVPEITNGIAAHPSRRPLRGLLWMRS